MADPNTITTTVTFADLIGAAEEELAEYREAYAETTDRLAEEFDAEADDPVPDTEGEGPASDLAKQAALQTAAQRFDAAGQQLQKRVHVLEQLRERYDPGQFEIKMLTGRELMDLETELKMEANSRGVEMDQMQVKRKHETLDRATVDAPDAVPREEESPTPSECPNPLAFALYEKVESLNTAGDVDFRAPGFGDEPDGTDLSAPETPSDAGGM